MDKLLYQINGRFVKREVIGDVPSGERTNFHYMAEIDGPELKGLLRGIDYALTVDSVVNVHIHEVLTTEEGDLITLERIGRSQPSEEEGITIIQGEGRAQTASERYAWLNEVPLVWQARFDKNSIHFTAHVHRGDEA